MVGESLARFGSNDFREGNNSSRAITAKDYEQLLRGFLQEFGACFQDEFVSEWRAWAGWLDGCMYGWMGGWLAGWVVGWFDCLLVWRGVAAVLCCGPRP